MRRRDVRAHAALDITASWAGTYAIDVTNDWRAYQSYCGEAVLSPAGTWTSHTSRSSSMNTAFGSAANEGFFHLTDV